MPSQSRSEGESMPDHWIWTESPDLERTVGVIEMEGLDSKEGFIKKKKRKNKEIARETIIMDQRGISYAHRSL